MKVYKNYLVMSQKEMLRMVSHFIFWFFCRINSLWILQYLQISSVSNYCRR